MRDNFYLLKEFISKYWYYDINKLTMDTTLDDIGMSGDDKYDFLIEYSKKFNVDILNIKLENYIDSEPGLYLFISSLFSLKEKNDVKPITLKMLFEAIEIGKWV